MHFHILGLGAIGSLFAHHLRRVLPPIHTITLIHKTTRQANEALAQGGIIRVERNGLDTKANDFRSEIFEALPVNEVDDPLVGSKLEVAEDAERARVDHANHSNMIESLFVTTKAHQTIGAIRRLLPRLSGNTTIVLMQNGMGVYERLVEDVFRNPEQRPHFILASNTHGAWLKGFYHVVHAGVGAIDFAIAPDSKGRDYEPRFIGERPLRQFNKLQLDHISGPSDPSRQRYESLQNTVGTMLQLTDGLNVSWKPMADVQLAMRRKLAVNAVINPLTAIMGCRNGDIFTSEPAHRIMHRVCQEAADVFRAQIQTETQMWLDDAAAAGSNVDDAPVGRVPKALTKGHLVEECLRVADLTKGNISSMLSDIQRGRRTEIDFINGQLLKLGSKYGVSMPANSMLLHLVKMRSSIPLDQMF